MALKSKTFSLLGLIFCVGCLIALIISFASDKWVVSTETEVIGFKHMGLWSICLDQYLPPSWALVDRFYTGCWWVLDKELELLRHYLFPSWFVGTQVLVTLGLCFELLALIGQIVNSIDCFPYSHARDKIAVGLSLGTAILHVLAGILLTVAVIMFGVRANNARSWLERPDQNYLSWSFGMCVLAAFLAFIAALCQLFEFLRLRLEYGHGPEPSVYLTEQAPPESRYAYSPTKVPPPPSNAATNGQPAYVSRYNKGSQGSLAEPRPPNTLFAVSGSGDVYINRMADYDDENDYYDRGRGTGTRERQMGRAGGSYSGTSNRYPYSSSGSSNPSGPQRANGTQPRQNSSVQNGSYRKANPTEHPVLPEYVPKSKRHTGTEEEESEDDIPEKQALESSDSEDDRKSKGTTHRKDKDKKSEAAKSKKSKKSSRDSDHEGGGHKSRRSSSKKSKRGDKSRDTDDDDRGSTHHSRSSSKRKSKHRSRSRDLNTSRDSYDSEASKSRGRSGSRSRHRSRSRSRDRGAESDGERSKRRRSSKRDGKSSKRDGYLTDETVGSEYSRSSKRKSRQRSSEAGRGHRDYSDGESVRGRGTNSRPSKPKQSYSSYYEY